MRPRVGAKRCRSSDTLIRTLRWLRRESRSFASLRMTSFLDDKFVKAGAAHATNHAAHLCLLRLLPKSRSFASLRMTSL
jgi:hypothetical protein